MPTWATSLAQARGERQARPRRYSGFRPAGALIGPQTRTAAARRGYADARLKALWSEIAGPEIAAVARPVKLTPDARARRAGC